MCAHLQLFDDLMISCGTVFHCAYFKGIFSLVTSFNHQCLIFKMHISSKSTFPRYIYVMVDNTCQNTHFCNMHILHGAHFFLEIHIFHGTHPPGAYFFKAHFFPSRMMEMKGIVVGRCYQTSSA